MTTPPPSAAANRARRPTWRDPRLALGVLLVAVCGLLGAKLLGDADNTIEVWALRHEVGPGEPLGGAALTTARVRFTSAEQADRYLATSQSLPSGLSSTRALMAGELLPRAALSDTGGASLVELPLTVPATGVPETVKVGSRVDVWATRKGTTRAERLLADVPVVALSSTGSGLSPSVERQVIVGLEQDQATGIGEIVGALSDATILLTRQAAQ
ncbi:MAG: hypothetical protein HZY75_14010 [Nocardioidaceae bacterium]|nr:MAG: hypothetical protein HZY75_14010 [Nocardioidaceae bacterium]